MTKQPEPQSEVDIYDIAQEMGMHVEEIIEAYANGDGTVVKTFDGQTYIIVPEDRPDAEGKTGLMWLIPPPRIKDGKPEPYKGTFPVFAHATEPLPAE